MIKRLIRFFYKERLIKTWKAGYDCGIQRGYWLGYEMGPRLDRELSVILKDKGVLGESSYTKRD